MKPRTCPECQRYCATDFANLHVSPHDLGNMYPPCKPSTCGCPYRSNVHFADLEAFAVLLTELEE